MLKTLPPYSAAASKYIDNLEPAIRNQMLDDGNLAAILEATRKVFQVLERDPELADRLLASMGMDAEEDLKTVVLAAASECEDPSATAFFTADDPEAIWDRCEMFVFD